MTEQTKNWYQVVIVLQVIVLSCCQDNEIISMSTTACDPSLKNCNCLDTQPPTMTLTCPLIAKNNLCDLPTVADEDYCQLSCGTCGKCSTTMLGCQCLSQWEFEGETYSGCENPDNDDAGSWCEINQESCSGQVYKPKKYDYCTEDCSVLVKLGSMTQPPSQISVNTSKDIGLKPQRESESIIGTLWFGAVSKSQIVVVNEGYSTNYLYNYFLKTSWNLVHLSDCELLLDPGESLFIPINLEGNEDQGDCQLGSRFFITTELSIVDSQGNIESKMDLKQFPLSSLDDSLSYCQINGEYTLISNNLCGYLL